MRGTGEQTTHNTVRGWWSCPVALPDLYYDFNQDKGPRSCGIIRCFVILSHIQSGKIQVLSEIWEQLVRIQLHRKKGIGKTWWIEQYFCCNNEEGLVVRIRNEWQARLIEEWGKYENINQHLFRKALPYNKVWQVTSTYEMQQVNMTISAEQKRICTHMHFLNG